MYRPSWHGITAIAVLLSIAVTALAQDATPMQRRAEGWARIWQDAGLMPGWVTLDDAVGIEFGPGGVGAFCIVDRPTNARWVHYGSVARAYAALWAAATASSALEIAAEWQAMLDRSRRVTVAEAAICDGFFARFPAPVYRPLGEPRYQAIIRVAPEPDAAIDWPLMSRASNILGTTAATDACGAVIWREESDHVDPLVVWANHPGGGLTRCRP